MFARGDYRPLEVTGALARHVVAFVRMHANQVSLTVVPRLPHALLAGRDSIAIPPEAWRDTALRCPAGLTGRRLHGKLGGAASITLAATLPIGPLLRDCPVSLHCTVKSP